MVFGLLKVSHLPHFLTLSLGVQHLHSSSLLLHKESTLDPSQAQLAHREPLQFFCFRQFHKDFRSYSTHTLRFTWKQTTCEEKTWCFPDLLRIGENNHHQGLGQPRTVRGYNVAEPMTVYQMLDHSQCP